MTKDYEGLCDSILTCRTFPALKDKNFHYHNYSNIQGISSIST